jgi:hypothetical protein
VWRFNTDPAAYDHWRKALTWPSAVQMTHLRDFFASVNGYLVATLQRPAEAPESYLGLSSTAAGMRGQGGFVMAVAPAAAGSAIGSTAVSFYFAAEGAAAAAENRPMPPIQSKAQPRLDAALFAVMDPVPVESEKARRLMTGYREAVAVTEDDV